MAHYAKSTKSMPSKRSSVLSNRSEKKFLDERKGYGDVHSFDKMLIMACERFQCPYTVAVTKEVKSDFYKKLKQDKVKIEPKGIILLAAKTTEEYDSKSSTQTTSTVSDSGENLPAIIVTMVYDNYNTLIEILMTMEKDVPRSLLRIIRLLLPYYRNLIRITMCKCRIKMYAVYELSKILNASTITELCLDGSSLSVTDYTMLLETTKLRYLSLCRCYIQDEACKSIAAKLHFKESAQNLLLLNLSSNRITDEGAKHISYALRTNRHLRYLNLADNHITDSGAGQILDMLTEFPLSYDEIVDMRRRRFEYLKRRNELYEKYLAQRSGSYDELSTRKSMAFKRRKTSLTSVKSKSSPRREKELTPSHNDEAFRITKAEMLTAEVLGPFEDPFHSKSIKRKEGHIHSIGNMTLAYLNLAFNNLSYLSLLKLQNVIQYQNNYRSTEKGLLKIVIEGNNLPISCPEIAQVEEIITKNIIKYGRKISEIQRQRKISRVDT